MGVSVNLRAGRERPQVGRLLRRKDGAENDDGVREGRFRCERELFTQGRNAPGKTVRDRREAQRTPDQGRSLRDQANLGFLWYCYNNASRRCGGIIAYVTWISVMIDTISVKQKHFHTIFFQFLPNSINPFLEFD